jgi:hypothetical protein
VGERRVMRKQRRRGATRDAKGSNRGWHAVRMSTCSVMELYGRCTPFLHMGSLPAGPGIT